MQTLINKHKTTRIIVITIFSPIMFYCANILLLAIFNFGTYCGTFLRGVFNLVV